MAISLCRWLIPISKTPTDHVGFVSESEEFAVATTVAKGGEIVGRTVRMEGKDATHLFLAVAVGGEETACEAAVDDLYLSAKNLYLGEKRLYPVVDARTHNEHLCAFRQGLLQLKDNVLSQQMTMGTGEVLTKGIKFVDSHPLEKMGKHLLLDLPV